ncbi:polysaccharide pyruvyl transferase family protein [Flavobacterium sp.]|uniref:polysaccharide pyruvyl transferase family protein n=1 Tax=Flavobacterium sp. TaxID=239 RepID=UPI0026215950|nr:polysaccharide pyruvyl transferase family protein [Flavobacterium sp.]
MKILMFFHNGSLNRGCEAIVRSSVALIKNQNPNAEVNLASFNPTSDKVIPLINTIFDATKIKISKTSLVGIIAALKFKLFKDENYYLRHEQENIIKHIPNHDILLSIGGDNYCYGEQPWVYEIDRNIKKAGKKLVLWGASIGDEDLSEIKINDLKSFDLILARESLTFEILKKNGIENVKLIADSAFTMQKEELPLPMGWQEGNTIGFNFSPLVWNKNKASQKASFDLIQHILDTTDMTIALTPHVIEKGNDDYECLLDFYNNFKDSGRVILLPNNLNAIQYKGYISRMRFFIGARTHATIAAYSTLIPTLVLGYSIKSKGIAKDIFGEEKLVLSIKEISDSQKLIAKFEEMKAEEKEIITTLANKIPEIKKMSQKAAEYLFEL